jgi:L,D-transpeptidase YcbB
VPVLLAVIAWAVAAPPAAAAVAGWLEGCRPTPQARAMVARLAEAADLGLEPADYQAAGLQRAAQELAAGGAPAALCAQFPDALEAALRRYVHDLHFGRVSSRRAGFDLPEPRPALDIPALLARLASARDPASELGAIEPDFAHYRLLLQALHRYRQLAGLAQPSLPDPGRRALRVGDDYAGAAALRSWLVALGDLSPAGNVPGDAGAAQASAAQARAATLRLDAGLESGLRRFQARHGLEADGALGRQTWQELRVPIAQRVRQIELTLERWRWLSPFTSPPIIVNVPQFRLFVFEGTEDRAAAILQMPVIVGRSFQRMRTPLFVGDIRTVVFRPYWDVPAGIVQREILPLERAKPGYLGRNGFELVDGQSDASPVVPTTEESIRQLEQGSLRLRQRPGGANALGLVKFMLPNNYGVYLHGTPTPELFSRSRRDFSHGCIRVDDPALLAQQVLRQAPGSWGPAAVAAALAGPDNQRVQLAMPVRVMVLYGTALATEAGEVMFFHDLYGLDRRLAALLREERPGAPR